MSFSSLSNQPELLCARTAIPCTLDGANSASIRKGCKLTSFLKRALLALPPAQDHGCSVVASWQFLVSFMGGPFMFHICAASAGLSVRIRYRCRDRHRRCTVLRPAARFRGYHHEKDQPKEEHELKHSSSHRIPALAEMDITSQPGSVLARTDRHGSRLMLAEEL